MFKIVHSKPVAVFLIFVFVIFCVPELLRGQEVGQGNIVGYVYGPDNTTPMEGAVLKLRNLSTGSLYESCLLYTSPSPRDRTRSRMPSSA